MPKTIFILLASVLCHAQTFISAGCVAPCVPAAGFVTDQYFTGGAIWNSSSIGYQSAEGTGIYAQMRYAIAFRYDIPANGPQNIALDFVEPDVPAPGMRVFSVNVNGLTSGLIDLFALTGANGHYRLSYQVGTPDGFVHISLTASVKNAVLSGIEITPVVTTLQPLKSTDTISGIAVVLADGTLRSVPQSTQFQVTGGLLQIVFNVPTIANWQQCTIATPTANCQGMEYLVLTHADGSEAGAFLMIPAPAGMIVSPPAWEPVTP